MVGTCDTIDLDQMICGNHVFGPYSGSRLSLKSPNHLPDTLAYHIFIPFLEFILEICDGLCLGEIVLSFLCRRSLKPQCPKETSLYKQ